MNERTKPSEAELEHAKEAAIECVAVDGDTFSDNSAVNIARCYLWQSEQLARVEAENAELKLEIDRLYDTLSGDS